MNITAAHCYSEGHATGDSSVEKKTHSCLIWPDRIVLNNLSDEDIPRVVDRVLLPQVIKDVEFQDIATVSTLERVGIVVSCLTNSDVSGK